VPAGFDRHGDTARWRRVRAETVGGTRIPDQPGFGWRYRVLDSAHRSGPHRGARSRATRTGSGSAPPTRPGRRPRSRRTWTPGLPRPTQPRATRASGRRLPTAATATSWRRRRAGPWPHRRSCSWTRPTRPPSSSLSGRIAATGARVSAPQCCCTGSISRAAGATHVTVACLGAPGHPSARGLYYGVGFREFTRDAPLIKPPAQVPSHHSVPSQDLERAAEAARCARAQEGGRLIGGSAAWSPRQETSPLPWAS
jgi:hypothetical protein